MFKSIIRGVSKVFGFDKEKKATHDNAESSSRALRNEALGQSSAMMASVKASADEMNLISLREKTADAVAALQKENVTTGPEVLLGDQDTMRRRRKKAQAEFDVGYDSGVSL